MADSALSSSAKGASYLILLQIGSRALTFALNQVLLRFLSPELLGISVQLELYCISVLYFSRESLRVALQRRADGVQTVVNLSYLALVAGPIVASLLATLYLRSDVPQANYVHEALRIYEVAALIELLTEPAYVAAQQKLLYKVRASAEATATITKTVATCGLAIWAHRQGKDLGVLPFAVGQMAYAVSLLTVYANRVAPVAASQDFSLLPRRIVSSQAEQYFLSLFYRPLLTLAMTLSVQSSIKYVLTQGDSILITSLASLKDQGAYALSSNYGGLIARMLFQPIEEASRNLFAKLCSAQPSQDHPGKPKDTTAVAGRSKDGIKQASSTLGDLLRFYNLISLVAFSIGPTAAPLLLNLVAGSKWSDTGAGDVLGTYCYYIPLLAINGVTEAFVAAAADNAELAAQSVWMGGFFAAFAGSAYLFLSVLGLGAKGLVYANCINMASRIVFNLSFVRRFFRRNGTQFDVLATLPTPASIAITAVVPGILTFTAGKLSRYGVLGEFVRVGVVAGVFGVVLLVLERRFLIEIYHRLRPAK